MLMVNSFGRVVDVDTEQVAWLSRMGMREATPAEADAHALKERQRAERLSESKARQTVFFSTVQSSPDGYGMSRDLIKANVLKLGTLLHEHFAGQKVGLLYSYPYGITHMPTEVRLVYTMFESDKIPEDWPDYLNAGDEVIVPSRWMQTVFAKSGVKSTVVPLGYNSDVFTFVERPLPVEQEAEFTFIHYNSFNKRKGFTEVLEAFTQEFAKNEPVKLIMKTTLTQLPFPLIKSEYPKIEVITGAASEKDLCDILARSNCMVYPSRGEGFGITPLEAMATGLPAIVPNEHGISEYFDPEYMLEVKAPGRCPGLYNRFRGQDVGEMVICDVDDLRRQMRYAYNHQSEMRELGRKASEYVKKFTYRQTAAALNEILVGWQSREIVKRPDSKYLKVDQV